MSRYQWLQHSFSGVLLSKVAADILWPDGLIRIVPQQTC